MNDQQVVEILNNLSKKLEAATKEMEEETRETELKTTIEKLGRIAWLLDEFSKASETAARAFGRMK